MIKKTLLFSLIVMLNSEIKGQSCDDMLVWKEILIKEYPNIVTNEGKLAFYRGRYVIDFVKDKIKQNLFSDKYFIPFAGKPFTEMSNKQKYSKSIKLNNCAKKGKFYNDELYVWMLKNINSAYGHSTFKGEFYWKVDWVNKKRKEYNELLSKLKNESFSIDELKFYKKDLDSKYGVLFDSERFLLRDILEKKLEDAVKIHAQKNISSSVRPNEQYIKDNVLKRGYNNYEYLMTKEDRCYFKVKVFEGDRHLSGRFKYTLIAIHNVSSNQSIFDIDITTKDLGFKVIRGVSNEDKAKLEKYFTDNIYPLLNKMYSAEIHHYVRNYHLENLPNSENNDFGIEDPLVSSTYVDRGGNNIIGSLGSVHAYGNTFNSTVELRKQFKEQIIESELKKEELRQKDILEKKEKARIAIQHQTAINNFFLKNKDLYKEQDFWDKFKTQSKMIKAMYEGDFTKIREGDYDDFRNANFFINIYIAHLSSSCKPLLPENYKTLTFKNKVGGGMEYTGLGRITTRARKRNIKFFRL